MARFSRPICHLDAIFHLVVKDGYAPSSTDYQSVALLLSYLTIFEYWNGRNGFSPLLYSWIYYSTHFNTPHWFPYKLVLLPRLALGIHRYKGCVILH